MVSDEEFLTALQAGVWGAFPFGAPNAVRPASGERGARAVVLGVYPSAFHVGWRAPDGSATIGALAVDVEPSVFWIGETTAAERAERIGAFVDAQRLDASHGSFVWAGGNGSSGRIVADEVLDPLELQHADCFFTDCVPFFFVKTGSTEQAGVIDARWRPWADRCGWPGGSLPIRPSDSTLVGWASHPQRHLADEIAASGAPAIITLGQAAADALRRVVEVTSEPPGLPLRVGDEQYGQAGRVLIAGTPMTWLPLAHPGATRRDPWRTHHAILRKNAAGLV